MKSLFIVGLFIFCGMSAAEAQVNERVETYINYVGCQNDNACFVNLNDNPNNCLYGNIYFPVSPAYGKAWHAVALTAFSMRKKLVVVFVKGANGLCGDVKHMYVLN